MSFLKKHFVIRAFLPATLIYFISSMPYFMKLMASDGGLLFGIDKIFHTAGGVAIAYLWYTLYSELFPQWWHTTPRILKIVLVATSACASGVAWEFYEFIHDLLYHTRYQAGLADTMGDLLYDSFGAILLATITSIKNKKPRA